ncbi:MAG: 50S ribosomal protein L28 [Candidatus Yanofskybacteria bacterium]|nr:50S ribosomal protein L28 [Candidatus Yanofskybacteria bacterium]
MTRCPQCGKKPVRAVKRKLLRGHYNPTKVYRQKPNLQWAKIPDKTASAGWRRIKICTDCIKTLHKVK